MVHTKIDAQNNVFAVGGKAKLVNNGFSEDAFAIKFDVDGNVVWTREFNAATFPNQFRRSLRVTDALNKFAFDSFGNIWATGAEVLVARYGFRDVLLYEVNLRVK